MGQTLPSSATAEFADQTTFVQPHLARPKRAPDGFKAYPAPVFDGDRVWAVTRDELGVQRVVRYRNVSRVTRNRRHPWYRPRPTAPVLPILA